MKQHCQHYCHDELSDKWKWWVWPQVSLVQPGPVNPSSLYPSTAAIFKVNIYNSREGVKNVFAESICKWGEGGSSRNPQTQNLLRNLYSQHFQAPTYVLIWFIWFLIMVVLGWFTFLALTQTLHVFGPSQSSASLHSVSLWYLGDETDNHHK